MSEELYRAIGRIEGKVDAMDARQKEIATKLDDVVKLGDQARGGIRALASVGAIAGVCGSAITAAFLKLKGGQ